MGIIKAKRALKKMVENGGNVSSALRAVGYSREYAHNPQKFQSTKTYLELVEEYLPDEMIAQKHKELVNAGEIGHFVFPDLVKNVKGKKGVEQNLTNDEIRQIVESVPGCRLTYVKRDYLGAHAFFVQPDSRSRKDAVDMAYKLKARYAPETINLTHRKYEEMSDEELVAHKKKLKDFLLKK